MPAPFLLDLSHTSHTRARTGIQRVTRSLHAALGDRAVAITHDPHRNAWRELQAWERANLAAKSPATSRGAQWPLAAKLGGATHRLLNRRTISLPKNAGLIVPEVFSTHVARALPALFAAISGPRIAIFHDAIALKFPELTPAKTVARFPSYLIELLAFDGVAAVSEDSRDALADYWRWLGADNPPPVQAIPLGTDTQIYQGNGDTAPTSGPPVVLSVGSIEGRKNHLALLDACERLWACGEKFSLHLIGIAHAQTGAAALARIRTLQAAGRPLRYDGAVGDAAVDAAYAACAFTVYPSMIEGFGLPVIESVSHGKPCICSGRGALAESARGGGCIPLATVDAPAIATAIARLLASPAAIATLVAESRARRHKTWSDYAAEVAAWAGGLGRRP
ncbi:MAG: glycosyltransferase [Opitutus sp.]|nr:glycosyltransferase [Opitutus sp.]